MVRTIQCKKCHDRVEGVDISFDEVSINNEWQKEGMYYICPKCKSGKKGKFKTNDSFNITA